MLTRLLVLVYLCTTSLAQPTKPLTPKEACTRFMSKVVRIDAGADTVASGFIISSDGWILTAGHVVFDHQTGQQLSTILVRLPDRTTSLAHIFVDRESVIRDFALLKVDKTDLPFLELGSWTEVDPGSEVTIIGYPFSAGADASITTKFCLSGLVAATDTVSNNGVSVDAIYFQGPVVKGLSGGPVISRDTGHVVGIQSQKLAGISSALAATRQ